jgi:selenocysteine lyase/cysteine desulfurase
MPDPAAAFDSVPPATSRRTFVQRLLAGTAGALAAPLVPSNSPAAAAGLPARVAAGAQDETYWALVQAQFPLADGVLPLNAANLAPAPRPVLDAVTAAMRDVEADVSFQNRAKYDALREQVRERLAAYLGAAADEIAIVRNTSEANNIIAGGLPLRAGDEVVLHAENHATNSVAWDVRAARYGFAVRRVAVRPDMSAAEMINTFRGALTPRTRVLSFTDVSNTTGIRLPARALCALARERGIHAHVDGAQSFGLLQLNLHELGCDSYAASAHKWFMGPKEAGVLYVRAARAPEIWPGVVGIGWGGTADAAPAGARRFETLGQRNDATTAGLDAALGFHDTIGPASIEARVLALAGALKDRLAQIPGATITTPGDPERSAGVVITRFAGVDHRALYERLYRDHGFAGAATGGLRLCPHIYTTMADIARLAAAVRAAAAASKAA